MSLSRILNDDHVPPTLPPPPSTTSWSEQTPAPTPSSRVDGPFRRDPSPQESIISGRISPAQSLNENIAPTSEVEPLPAIPPPLPEVPQAPTPSRAKGRSKAAKLFKDSTPSVSQSQQAGDEVPAAPKKRRKANAASANANSETKAPRTRRTSLRKQAAKAKANLPQTPLGATPEPDIIIEQPLRPLTEEELRLLSSDLSDCEEVWRPGMWEYEQAVQFRRRQVVDWFETSEMEKNALTAQEMSHHYNAQISRIPPPPPPPTHSISRHDDLGERSPFADYPNGHENGDRQHRHRHKGHQRRYDSGAEDAAHELERSILGDFDDLDEPRPPTKKLKKTKENNKRPPSDAGSDREAPPHRKEGHASKKRKLENGSALKNESLDGSPASTIIHLSKGKARVIQREGSIDSVSVTATPKGRKKGPKKKGALLAPDVDSDLPSASHPPSVAGDATPAASRPGSPVPGTNGVIFELEEHAPPLKKAKRMDDATMAKRVKSLEEAQKKVWTNIAKRDIAKVYKYQVSGYQARQSQMERIAKVASLQARRPFTKTAKATKDTQAKAKRLMREMQVFWKKNEKEERDVRKREQKEASDRLKVEEEKREAARQARKLEFLISQTELYSHFVGSKLKTTEIEGDGESLPLPAGANVADVEDPAKMLDINFDDEDTTNLHQHARHNAQEAIALAKQRAQAFDTQAALDRKTNEALALAKAQAHIHDAEDSAGASGSSAPLVDLDSDELNFQNPTSLSGPLTIGQPKMLMAQLKEYQLKGLNWLATLYEQGINGILADEMGLGKTVQSISLLAYLAETHDIWGPFLVVAPASTLHNWQQEITRFVPGLKALPYWGNVKDRATLRKFWSKKEISYNRDAPFHVLVTSYQLVTQDQQYFQRVKWQYMILDEAQNIKNSASVRWKTLLGFQCRNRLLLTGTPIQNSMQELWALLHFIMPSLFDSHDEFNEWFSKDIENAAENKGSKLNEHQLRRLHMILKPFMLRRVKRHVQNELSEKIEIDIYVDLSARQRALYNVLLSRVSVADLLAKAANFGDAESARSLMNLVMQFRKVCNHPELFERADVVAPFSFSDYGRTNTSFKNEGDFVLLPYSSRNPIEFSIPKLFYLDGGLVDVPQEDSTDVSSISVVTKMFNIWSSDWIERSLNETSASSFSFLRFLDIGTEEVHALHRAPLIRRRLLAIQAEATKNEIIDYCSDSHFAASSITSPFQVFPAVSLSSLATAPQLPALHEISSTIWTETCLSRPGMKWFIPPVVAPPISMYCSERTFLDSQTQLRDAPVESLALYGLPPAVRDSVPAGEAYHKNVPSIPPSGLFGVSPQNQIPAPPMQVPEAKRLIYDSAKLARLDALLHELKKGDHRVLVYFQMTRMMDLMEEYLIYRQYKYLRLDGSSKLEDRRDMVIDWQTRPDIFVFLLSTRAGGLGINLTAADTVVFYDHDWNPSNDAQAMDRAHRLGQTRQVTVYRLVTKGTIDERIVQLARVKKDVQDIVVGNKNFTDVAKPSEIVQLLLNDEQLANLNNGNGSAPSTEDQKAANSVSQDMWNDDEDGFFGHSGPQNNNAQDTDGNGNGNGTPVPSGSGRGRKRKPGGTGAPRGRKPGTGKKKASVVEDGVPVVE